MFGVKGSRTDRQRSELTAETAFTVLKIVRPVPLTLEAVWVDPSTWN